jgi:hypothetical protein
MHVVVFAPLVIIRIMGIEMPDDSAGAFDRLEPVLV